MSAHTPGPWNAFTVESASINPYGAYMVAGPTTRMMDRSVGFTKEDATLIASAPDLLALCVQSRALMSTMLAEELNIQECIRNISKVNVLRTKIAALSLAIARATGGEV